MEFKELGLSNEVLKSIESLGYNTPSKIQEQMIPLIMKGEDLIGQAQTGTGKTLAYAASILSKTDIKTNVVKAIILVPTRELALQVTEEFVNLNKTSKFDILPVYGGTDIRPQINSLKEGVDIVVGTPGRVEDLMRKKKLNIDNLEFFVLDEADEMLDMGFQEDIETIFKETNTNKQVLMLSATMPDAIEHLATKYMKKNYEHIIVESVSKTADTVKQYFYLVNEKTRNEVLCRVLDLKNSLRTIVFCQTKNECDDLLTNLAIRGYNAEAMHGDISQDMRIKTLGRFKSGSFKVLIATDVAARGIHVDDVDVVINYRLPQEFESYIHRIGRTGRAEHTGEAISLVTSRELRTVENLEKFANCKIEQKDVPSKEEIEKLRYNIVLNNAKNISDYEQAIPYIRDMNKGELMNLTASLLTLCVQKDLGSDFDKNIIVREKSGVKEGTTRVFLTIGKKDGLKQGSLLDFMKTETGIDKDNFNNIELLKTFTFIDVTSTVVDEFMKKINNKKFKERIIRVEKAKRQK